MNTSCRQRRGAGLVELLVVLAIMGMVLGLGLSAVQRVRAAAEALACQNSMRQVAMGIHHYHLNHQMLPNRDRWGGFEARHYTWMVFLLPYVEEGALWQTTMTAMSQRGVWPFQSPPHLGYVTPVPVYVCPADRRLLRPLTNEVEVTAAYHSYVGVGGDWHGDTMWNVYERTFGEVHDGLSNTLMLAERPPPASLLVGRWYTNVLHPRLTSPDLRLRWPSTIVPYFGITSGYGLPFDCVGTFTFGPGRLDNDCDRLHYWSLHRGGANFAFGDGSVRFLSYKIERDLYFALATISGGEAVSLPD